jgi:glycosyltransferase involved in cell wall biosynthesis
VTQPDIAVVIPAFNESASIARVLADIPPGLAAKVVVVNNSSTDDTAAIATGCGATVLYERQRGYGSACMCGVTYLARGSPTPDVVVFLDADYADYPGDMPELTRRIVNNGCDLAIGCRQVFPGAEAAMPFQQVWGNSLALVLIRLLYGVKFSDLGPFRAIRFAALMALDLQDRTYGWPVEMQLKAVKRGFKICEVPVRYRKRIGQSKISGTVMGTILAGYKIISTIIRYR